MNNLCGNEFLTGPYDECLACPYLKNGCSGPRTNAMTLPRWIVWIKDVMKRFGIKASHIARDTFLSKSTVDDILAGRRKDISRDTCCIIENYVLGDGKWPCPMLLAEDKDVVYQDRPETLEILRARDEELIEKCKQLDAAKAAYESDLQQYKDQIHHLYTQIDRKDDYIDRLAKKAGI